MSVFLAGSKLNWTKCAPLAWAAAVALVTTANSPAFGQPTDPSPNTATTAEPAKYRRVFVPADRPEEWPTDGQRYLPIDRAEFERLVDAADERRQLSEPGGAQIVKSQYAAKLADDLALTGQATFTVQLVDPSPRVLKLAPFNAAVVSARWNNAGAEETPALLGVWTRPDAVDEYGVLVERSGELVVDWSARSKTGTASDLEYRLDFPVAVAQELVVDLPADCSAVVSSARLITSAPLDGAALTRWKFQLGAASEHRLQVRRRAAAAPQASSLPIVAVTEAYGVTPEGLEYEAELRVQQRSAAAGELRLAASPSLRVSEVLVDRVAINLGQGDDNGDAIVVPLPNSSAPITVTVRGIAETTLEELWKLPSIAVQNAFWTEGTSTLWIDPALELQSITPQSGRLLNLVGVDRPEGGEAYRLQAWSSDASTEVIVAPRSSQMHAEVGCIAEFADRELAGRCQARIWATGGPILQAAVALEPQWNVESVDASPADALAEWHVSGEGRARRLHIQLRRSPTELAPLRLNISARKSLRGWTPVATLGELEWIRFSGVAAGSGHLMVRDRRGNELQADRAALDGVVSLDSLSASYRELMGEPAPGMLFASAALERSAKIRVMSKPPRFHGEAWIALTRTDAGFGHVAEISCRPVVGAVSELLVATARPLPADARWTLVGSDAAPPIVEPVAERSAPPSVGDVTPITQYRVRFAQPPSGPFRLRVNWRGDGATLDAVNSITLPGAESWQSWALLRGNPSEVQVDPRGCAPAAAVPAMEGFAGDRPEAPAVIGCYRLGDDPSTPLALAPTIAAVAAPSGAQAGVTCWLCNVATLQFADGNQTHRIAYQLEVNGGRKVELVVPKEYDVVSARVGDATLALEPLANQTRRLTIPLPSGPRAVTVTIDLHGRRRGLDAAESVAPPLPKTSFAVLRGRWTVSAPAPYTVESEAVRHANAGWRPRLFGPLANPTHDAATGPFRMGVALGAAAPSAGIVANNESTPDLISVPHGWSTATQEFVTAPVPIDVRRIDDTRGLWHVAWLIAAVTAVRLWAAHPRAIAALVGVLAIGCLVLPVSWIALPQAILLGTLGGALMRELLSRTRRPEPVVATSPSRVAAIVTSLLIAMASAGATLHAAEPSAPPPGVLYPLDDQKQPAGEDIYAPASLLNELLPSTQRRRYDGVAYALFSAVYQIDLTQDVARHEASPSRGELRFRVRTFQRNVPITLPLDSQDADWQASAHTLDGAPADFRWYEEGGCSIEVGEPGEHELVLKFIPRGLPSADRTQISLRVPSIPGAVVDVSHPAGLEGLAIGGDRLATSVAQPARTVAKLAATNRLELSWPKRLRANSSGVAVDQLTWLEVDPAVAHLEVRLRLTGDAASLATLELATSPQLRLLPLSDDSPVEEVRSTPGSPTIIELKFRSPPQLPLMIPLQFQVLRSVSLGRIDFPSVRVLGASTASHYFAATIDRRLRAREDSLAEMTPAPVAEVERAWGALPSPPALQYAVAPGDPAWSLTVEPAALRFTSREAIDVLCTADDARVSYVAAISDMDGEKLVYRLVVSPTMTIDAISASLDDQGEAVPVRWSRPRPDLVSVFMSRPLSEPHTIRVSARAPYSEGRRLRVPKIGLESTRTTAIPLSVRRTSEILAAWSGDAEAPPPAPGSTVDDSAAGLLVGQYSVARNAELIPELEITANEARFSADALLTLDLKPTDPVGTMVLHGRVTHGVVDRVRLIADKNWRGPLVAEPGAVVVARPSPQDADRQVIEVRLNETVAAGSDLNLKLSGPVALETDQRVRFPNVRLLAAEPQRLFLTLPKTPANQTAEWTIRNLERRPLPADLAEAAGLPQDVVAYEAELSRFVAEQRVFPEALRQASVRLAETQVALDDAGNWSAVTELIVQPGGATELAVKLPEGAELFHIAVDGRAVVQPKLQQNQWMAPTGSRYLPRVFTIAYNGRQEVRSGRFEFQVPQVSIAGEALTVARSLWQVEGGPAVQLIASDGGRALSNHGFNSAARRAKIAAVVDAGLLALQLPEWELRQWFQPWLDRLHRHDLAEAANGRDPVEAAWRTLQERIAALATATGDDVALAAGPDAAYSATQGSAWFQGTADGRLRLARVANGRGLGRWVLALAIVGAWGAAWRHPDRFAPLLDVVGRWPAALGVFAGLFWWAFLTPTLLGPPIVLISLAGLVKNWRWRRLQQSPVPVKEDRSEHTSVRRTSP